MCNKNLWYSVVSVTSPDPDWWMSEKDWGKKYHHLRLAIWHVAPVDMSQSFTAPSHSVSLQREISTKREYHFKLPSRRIENGVRVADSGKRMKEVERVEGEWRGRRECYWIVTKATDHVEGAKKPWIGLFAGPTNISDGEVWREEGKDQDVRKEGSWWFEEG